MYNIFQDNYFYYLRKPRGVASVYGKKHSVLDSFDYIYNYDKSSKNFFIINELINIFGTNKEYGLLNRLDNDTGGLLYFAKNIDIYNKFKYFQNNGKIQKIYLADVYGKINNYGLIGKGIMHHKYDNSKMITIHNNKSILKGRGIIHYQITAYQLLYYDKINNISTIKIFINKGVRHQIRVHFAGIGSPIVGDKLYSKKIYSDKLHLRSIGLKINID